MDTDKIILSKGCPLLCEYRKANCSLRTYVDTCFYGTHAYEEKARVIKSHSKPVSKHKFF